MTTPSEVIAERRRQRDELIGLAGRFADALPASIAVRGVVVFGSIARGDFNVWSDIDVLVVAEDLPTDAIERLRVLGDPPPRVRPVAWTPAELSAFRAKRNPIAVEAEATGVWLVGLPHST